MMWVKDTLPPRARARWLLMTVRLSQSSFTGTERTLVAVGTLSEMSMFCAVRAGAPRSTVSWGSSLASGCGAGSGSFGTGAVVLGAAFAGVTSARGRAAAALLAWGVGFSAGLGAGFAAGFSGAFFAGAFAAACSGALAPFGRTVLSVTCSPGW